MMDMLRRAWARVRGWFAYLDLPPSADLSSEPYPHVDETPGLAARRDLMVAKMKADALRVTALQADLARAASRREHGL